MFGEGLKKASAGKEVNDEHNHRYSGLPGQCARNNRRRRLTFNLKGWTNPSLPPLSSVDYSDHETLAAYLRPIHRSGDD